MRKIDFFLLAFLVTVTPLTHADGGFGMAWAKRSHDSTLGIDQVSCNQNNCNPYHGETSCKVSLPVLCLKVDGSISPAYLPQGGEYYDGWARGHIATTMPIQGIALSTPIAGDQFCQATFGSKWRMAEFHDGQGGWQFRAYGNVRDDQSHWVRVRDQPGNCWNP